MIIEFPSQTGAIRFFEKYGNDTRVKGLLTKTVYAQKRMPYDTEMWLRDKCTIEFLLSDAPVVFYKQDGDETEFQYRERKCRAELLSNGIFVAPCDTCRYRQRGLDPDGCFKQIGSTGFVGRLIILVTGCAKYVPDFV